MDPDAIRSEVDRHLSEQLLQNRHIQRIQVAMEGQKSSQTRRSLLARALLFGYRHLLHLRHVKLCTTAVQYSRLRLKLNCTFIVAMK